MRKIAETREQIFEDFKRFLEADTCCGDEKLAGVLHYLDAIINAPAVIVH